MTLSKIAPAFVFFGLLAWTATAEDDEPMSRAEYVRTSYTKFEHRVPMRDGKLLFTAVYSPNDTEETYPILMFRTPYSVSPYGADRYRQDLGPSEELEKEGFIFVFQDVRGRFMSEGEYVNMRPHIDKKKTQQDIDESTDTFDTIEWLLKNVPNTNGRVGQWGVSYPGFYSSAGMIDSHPALKAVSPQAPIADWFWDDMHHHGAFILPLAFKFFSVFGQAREELTTERPDPFDYKTPDGYQFFLDLGPLKNVNEHHFEGEIDFWNKLTEHPSYDELWQSRNLLPHLRGITAAVMVVGGWFDTEDLYGPLKTYKSIEDKNPGIHNTIVMGPWRHGGWRDTGNSLGTADFGFKSGKDFRKRIELPFFLHFLKDGDEPQVPEALMFETGANRWRSFDAWPPPQLESKTLYFQEEGALGWQAPSVGGDAFDEYPSDPAKPVPYTTEITTRWAWK